MFLVSRQGLSCFCWIPLELLWWISPIVQCVDFQYFGDKWKIWANDKTLFYLWKAKGFISLFDFAQKQGSSYSQRKALAPEASDISNLSALLKRRLDKKTTSNFIIENFRPPTIWTDAVNIWFKFPPVILLNCHLEITIYQQIVILLLILYFARPT